MQDSSKFLEMAAYVCIFCTAVTLLLFYNRSINKLITSAKNEANYQNNYYESEQSLAEILQGKISYAEVIASLIGDLDYDIQINDMTILKESYNYQNFDFSAIPQTEYTKSYLYDSSGKIVKVIYKR
jgi:hypothetical protein